MKVLIWGAGKGCKKAFYVCEKLNWDIVAIIDSNIALLGNTKLGKIIISPSEIDEIEYDGIVFGTECDEVLELAHKYTNIVISWNQINQICLGIDEPREDIVVRELENINLRNCRALANRTELLHQLKKSYQVPVTVVEIGVAYGDYSVEILNIINPEKLILIDAWEGERYGNGKSEVERKLGKQIDSNQVELLQGYSVPMLEKLPDYSIDIAYIDTNHSYETTWEELLVCARKVKENGYICGHDYVNVSPISRFRYGVVEAVNRFCVEYNYEIVFITMETNGYHSFALKKI